VSQSAYVFGPWTFPTDPTDQPILAYRSAPREDDRAEVWLYVPDDGSPPVYAGCFGGGMSVEFRDGSVTTLADACRALDARIVAAGHYLYEQVQATAQHWQNVSGVAREVIAQHRGGPDLMADDDLVDVIARALKDFPGLVRERDRLQAVIDAERGVKGLPGWVYRTPSSGDPPYWEMRTSDLSGAASVKIGGRGVVIYGSAVRATRIGDAANALDGMERAEAHLRALGLLPAKD